MKNLNFKSKKNSKAQILTFLVFQILALFSSINADEIVDKMIKGIEFINLGLYENALNEFKSINHSTLCVYNLHLCLGVCYMNIGKFEESVEEFKQEIKLNPGNDKSYYFLAMISEYREEKKKSIFYWNKFLELSKNKELRNKASRHLKYLKDEK